MDISIFEFGHVQNCKMGCHLKNKNRMANSVDPDETARHEPSHPELHCLPMFLF